MNDTIICPHCNQSIPLSKALSHQMIETHQKEIVAALQKQKLTFENEQKDREQQLIEKAQKNVEDKLQLTLRDRENESRELIAQNKALQEQILELNKLLRQLRQESQQKNIEFEKRLTDSQEKLRIDAEKRLNTEFMLKVAEKDKQLQDLLKVNAEMKRKIEQGSQQTQGEVLELELEEKLKQAFIFDDIVPVAKGVRGGDIVQIVRNRAQTQCGKIIWEMKRTKVFSKDWILKLKDDKRRIGADVAVLISNVLPSGIDRFGQYDGVWVGDYEAIIGLSTALRSSLIDIASVKASHVNRNEKLAVLHEYISGVEFKHKVEAIVEAFTSMQVELEKEKNWFAKKWGRQEQAIRKALDQTHGMHGQLQGIMGKALPDIEEMKQLDSAEEKIFEPRLFSDE